MRSTVLLTVLLAVGLWSSQVCASEERPKKAAEFYTSCFYNVIDHTYALKQGKFSDAFAYGFFDDTYEANGAGHLYIWSNPKYADREQMSCAGYLEGYLSGHRIKDFYRSYRESTYPTEALYERIKNWVSASLTWTLESVLVGESRSPYWSVVGLTTTQLLGVVEGYNAKISDYPLSTLDIFMMNSIGDMDDLVPALNYTMHKETADEEVMKLALEKIGLPGNFREASSPQKLKLKANLDVSGGKKAVSSMCSEPWCIMTAQANSHCSSIVKPVNGALYAAHEMWTTYAQMLMVWKQYDFGLVHTPGIVSRKVGFSSWPGMLSSEDDFYITEAKLVVMETTNNVYNFTLYDKIKPQSLLSWVRAITANYMSSTPDHWHKMFQLYNSGTYNNQWIVVNMKSPFVTPGVTRPMDASGVAANHSLVAMTVMIGSQLPGYYRHADVSHHINAQGYWPSYNVPYFENVWKMAGYDVMAAKYGEQFTWSGAPRAKIFKQRQSSVVDVSSLQRLMRYNDWKNDPLSLGCPMNQLASRGDLSPAHLPLCYRNAFGAVNAKITNSRDVARFRTHFTAGPTHDTQPVFSWTPEINALFPTPHYGQPHSFNFGWQVTEHP